MLLDHPLHSRLEHIKGAGNTYDQWLGKRVNCIKQKPV
jgi:hypothetical protein